MSRGPPEHHVPHGEEVHVLAPELLVLLHVVLDELHQRRGVELVQPPLVYLLHGGGRGCNNTHLTTTFSQRMYGSVYLNTLYPVPQYIYSQMKRMEDTLLSVSWLMAVKGLLGPLPGLLE